MHDFRSRAKSILCHPDMTLTGSWHATLGGWCLGPRWMILCVLSVLVLWTTVRSTILAYGQTDNRTNAPPSIRELTDRVDHHVHLLSPQLISDWKSLGMPFSRDDKFYCEPHVVLEQLAVRQACLVSMAHLYSSAWFERLVPTPEKELELVVAENDFIVSSIAKHPEQLVGFYSLHPTRDPVVALRDRYVGQPGMIGWKMHLPACGVDLANPDEFQKLESAFAWCAAHQQCILIHLFSGDEAMHLAERFWKLVEPHPELQIVLAHCGTSGGYNDLPESLLRGYLELLERKPEFSQAPIFFDLSGAVLIAETDGLPATSAENCARLAAMMRRIGLAKFLYATDYPVFSPNDLQIMLETRLQLSADERETIANNRLPKLESRRK